MRNDGTLIFALLVFFILYVFFYGITADAMELTPEERETVASAVYAEAGGEDETAMEMIAQCILNGCELEEMRPAELLEAYQYTSWRPEPSETAFAAVDAVFIDGERPIEGTPLYFYAGDRINSPWHESQAFLTEYRGIRFFMQDESSVGAGK
ncbi:MAG TPA: hypothetical protein PLU75_06045 [Oscillospiraceae bacterium]|nr:hypothetical protein [Oscillospiraceae bacterium]HRW57809.1 hypothetical protein [Oscillospiraceae bacterium]